MKVDFANLKRKLQNILTNLPVNIDKQLKQIGTEMVLDITSTQSYSHSPSWQAAIHASGPYAGQPYFKQPGQSHGLIDALREEMESHSSVTNSSKGIFNLGFGHIPTIEATIPYYRMFDLIGKGPVTGSRIGAKDDLAFLPRTGAGKREEGYFVNLENHPDSGKLNPWPGTLAVHLFSDEFEFYRKTINKKIQQSIRDTFKKEGF